MSDLMDTLLADQRRLEEVAEAIPGLQVQHFDAPARSPRAELLMAINAEQRTLIEALQERNAAQTAEIAALKAKIASMTAASSLIPQPGHVIVDLPIPGTGATAVVEAYYEAPEPATRDEPGDPGECYAESVLISTRDGDRLVNITDLFGALNDERAVTKAVEAMR